MDSIVQPIVRAIAKPIVDRAVDSSGSEFQGYYFNGVNQYAIMGQSWESLGDPDIYVDITWVTNNEDGFIIDPTQPISEFGRVGSDYHEGPLRSLRIADRSPLQNRTSCIGNVSRRVVLRTPIILASASNWKITFSWLRKNHTPNTNATRFLGNTNTPLCYLQIFDTNAATKNIFRYKTILTTYDFAGSAAVIATKPLNKSLTCSLEKNGNNMILVIDGDEVETVVDPTPRDFTITQLASAGATQAQALAIDSQLGDVLIEDFTTNRAWFYPLELVE